jgi:hypothetical protein
MKTSSVDLVVTGDETAAVAAALDAVRRGQRVLVVLRSDDARVVPRLRRLCGAAKNQLTVITNAEVVCVDGVDGVEAVVVRYTRTGRLCACTGIRPRSCRATVRGSLSVAAEPAEPISEKCSGSGDRCTSLIDIRLRRVPMHIGWYFAKRDHVLCQNCVRYPFKPRSNTVIYGASPTHIVVAGSR